MKNKPICCGEEVASNFCPHCGKLIDKSPIKSLLAHVALYAKNQRKRVEEDEASTSPHKRQEYSDKLEQLALKWEGWHQALAELIAKEK